LSPRAAGTMHIINAHQKYLREGGEEGGERKGEVGHENGGGVLKDERGGGVSGGLRTLKEREGVDFLRYVDTPVWRRYEVLCVWAWWHVFLHVTCVKWMQSNTSLTI
jgi:hypothetical protein